MAKKRNVGGRPRLPENEKSKKRPVQIGRQCPDEIALIDAAADLHEQSRSEWAWPVLVRLAKRQLRVQYGDGKIYGDRRRTKKRKAK